ncbi:MAG: hypothetical protein WKF46_02060 [Candidatus Limnocylindrales bacterium]|jgi:hypothetical protein|nr:hypothetical protein [Chloroflexota bacterium]
MEAARIVQLPTTARLSPAVTVDGDRLTIEHLTLVDPALSAFVAEREAADRPLVVERALRIGLTALQDAGVTLDVDVVRREFETHLARTTAANDKAAAALDVLLRQNFADGDGRLPRTLEHFLGDRGQLRAFVNDLFDEGKRDSAIGRIRSLLGTYFDGDASRLAQLLDPTRLGSPLHQFRTEVSDGFAKVHERLTAIEAAALARASERSRSAAKGADFEEQVEAVLADLARGSGDLLDRTTDEKGDVMGSKKGDFLLTMDAKHTRGAEVRIVVECKDRPMSGRAMREELEAAKRNRAACVALVCFSTAHAPSGIAPFDVRAGDVYCVLDPEAPDRAVLEAAVRLARLLALATLREQESDIDPTAIAAALVAIRNQLDAIRTLKTQLTSIGTASLAVNAGLDKLREGVLARVAEAEEQLRADRLAPTRLIA